MADSSWLIKLYRICWLLNIKLCSEADRLSSGFSMAQNSVNLWRHKDRHLAKNCGSDPERFHFTGGHNIAVRWRAYEHMTLKAVFICTNAVLQAQLALCTHHIAA